MLRLGWALTIALAALACAGDDETAGPSETRVIRVIAEESGAPVGLASIAIDGDDVGATDESGRLEVEIPTGSTVVTAHASGRVTGTFVGEAPPGDLVIAVGDPAVANGRIRGTVSGWETLAAPPPGHSLAA